MSYHGTIQTQHQDIARDLPHLVEPIRFKVIRKVDKNGVSCPGYVADGVFWPNGLASMAWRGDSPSVDLRFSLRQEARLHGHNGDTKFVLCARDAEVASGDDGLTMAQQNGWWMIAFLLHMYGTVVESDDGLSWNPELEQGGKSSPGRNWIVYAVEHGGSRGYEVRGYKGGELECATFGKPEHAHVSALERNFDEYLKACAKMHGS